MTSVSAQDFLAVPGTPAVAFPSSIARWRTSSAQSGTTKRNATTPAKQASLCDLDRLTNSDAYLAIFAPPSVASRTRPEAIVAARRHNRSPTRPTAGGEELSLETGSLVEGAAAAQVTRLVKGVLRVARSS
jgi:hypothetical protein